MKHLTVLLAFAFVVSLVIAAHFAMDCYVDSNANTPPADQVAESIDSGLESNRSGSWPTVRNRFVELHPVCEACGSDEELNVHHIKPFHVSPELELDMDNLITLCREHHFRIGHDPDGSGPLTPNWKLSNPNVRADARKYLDSLSLTP